MCALWLAGCAAAPARAPDPNGTRAAREARHTARKLAPQWLGAPNAKTRFEAGNAFEYEASSNTIIAGTSAPIVASPTAWLHEMAHAAMVGPRPNSTLEKRIWQALEEGAADYIAFQMQPNMTVQARDPRHAPPLRVEVFIGLGLVGFPFDAHSLGHRFSHQLWRAKVSPKRLAKCLARGATDAVVGVAANLAHLVKCAPELKGPLNAWAEPMQPQGP